MRVAVLARVSTALSVWKSESSENGLDYWLDLMSPIGIVIFGKASAVLSFA